MPGASRPCKRAGTELVLFAKRQKFHRSLAPKQQRTLEGILLLFLAFSRKTLPQL
jgi:hypothetical protein